jgi:hypothetical protein
MSESLSSAYEWLLEPLSGSSTHHLEEWIVWHARLMVLAWAILLPLGVLAARYFKVTHRQDWPRVVDNRAWWHAHRLLQYSGIAFMLIGLSIAWDNSKELSTAAAVHSYLGLGVIAVGILQVLSAWFRGSKGGPSEPEIRGDHYDMTPYRLKFEWIHKTCGWTALIAAVVTMGLGLWVADAPRWMPLVLTVWWIILIVCAVRLERAGRCIDTYQAIWGPDLKHPGNQRPNVGWGMLRLGQTREK